MKYDSHCISYSIRQVRTLFEKQRITLPGRRNQQAAASRTSSSSQEMAVSARLQDKGTFCQVYYTEHVTEIDIQIVDLDESQQLHLRNSGDNTQYQPRSSPSVAGYVH